MGCLMTKRRQVISTTVLPTSLTPPQLPSTMNPSSLISSQQKTGVFHATYRLESMDKALVQGANDFLAESVRSVICESIIDGRGYFVKMFPPGPARLTGEGLIVKASALIILANPGDCEVGEHCDMSQFDPDQFALRFGSQVFEQRKHKGLIYWERTE